MHTDMGLLDRICDAILGESQSNDNRYYDDDYDGTPIRRQGQPTRVRVTWNGYYRSTSGYTCQAHVDEVIPDEMYRRLSCDCEATNRFLRRVIYDCEELESNVNLLNFEGYV